MKEQQGQEYLLLELKSTNFPVYISEDLRPLAWPKKGASSNKVMVCSIPKAGTYFISEILKFIGIESTHLHLWMSGFSDYRFASLKEFREESEKFTRNIPLKVAVKLIASGQFAVGHIPCTDDTKEILSDFKKIFLCRNLKDAAVSYMRFLESTGRLGWHEINPRICPTNTEKMIKYFYNFGKRFLNQCRDMLGWLDEGDVLKIKFEELYGDYGTERQKEIIVGLCDFINSRNRVEDINSFMEHIKSVPTGTSSGLRTKREIFWDEEIEKRFISLGGDRINSVFGYE